MIPAGSQPFIPSAEVLLVGGGAAHIEVVRRYKMLPLKPYRLILINDQADAPYSGMIPGYLAGDYGYDDVHIDLGHLCHDAGVTLIVGEVKDLDPISRQIRLSHSPLPLNFDALSLNVGSEPLLPDVLRDADYVLRVKPMSDFIRRLTTIEQ